MLGRKSEVEWLRERVENLTAEIVRMKHSGYQAVLPLDLEEPVPLLSDPIMDAIGHVVEKDGDGFREMVQWAEEQMDDEIDEEHLIDMIHKGRDISEVLA
jgi:hypothetical protein